VLPGNTAGSALIRQVKDDMRDWCLSKVIWVADRGFTPAENRRYLRKGGGRVCLGVGAGLIRADLRTVRGSDIARRSGGVIVQVNGNRPRAVPVLAHYHEPLLASAAFAGTGLVTGGRDPARRNVTTPLIRALAAGTGLPTGRDLQS
jgi:hypothetical protein